MSENFFDGVNANLSATWSERTFHRKTGWQNSRINHRGIWVYVFINSRGNRQFCGFFHSFKSNCLFFRYLRRKKSAFLPLLVIHLKHAISKNERNVLGDEFRIVERWLKCLWHDGWLNRFWTPEPLDFVLYYPHWFTGRRLNKKSKIKLKGIEFNAREYRKNERKN